MASTHWQAIRFNHNLRAVISATAVARNFKIAPLRSHRGFRSAGGAKILPAQRDADAHQSLFGTHPEQRVRDGPALFRVQGVVEAP